LQVGILLNGTTVVDMVMGSPASVSRQISKGDIILEVDNKEVNPENVIQGLCGQDIPGTEILLKIATPAWRSVSQETETKHVTLVRKSQKIVDNRRQLFELLGSLKV
jgi:C-terminal processing protease CtpA/Prc